MQVSQYSLQQLLHVPDLVMSHVLDESLLPFLLNSGTVAADEPAAHPLKYSALAPLARGIAEEEAQTLKALQLCIQVCSALGDVHWL